MAVAITEAEYSRLNQLKLTHRSARTNYQQSVGRSKAEIDALRGMLLLHGILRGIGGRRGG